MYHEPRVSDEEFANISLLPSKGYANVQFNVNTSSVSFKNDKEVEGLFFHVEHSEFGRWKYEDKEKLMSLWFDHDINPSLPRVAATCSLFWKGKIIWRGFVSQNLHPIPRPRFILPGVSSITEIIRSYATEAKSIESFEMAQEHLEALTLEEISDLTVKDLRGFGLGSLDAVRLLQKLRQLL